MSSSLIGRKLGAYEITELLGQGGMATVYKGYQESVDRFVAVKVLPPHPGLNDQFIKRFQLEARTIGSLQHPHILPLYDYGAEDDILYLVMAYVDGGSLEDLIDRGPMPVRQVEKLLREIASALDYAHRKGVIHRDIKPGNILLDSEGHALLADFGIVKKMTGSSPNLTGTGTLGTPAYMAPEQGQGLEIDPRADIYALGVVVYEMLTGQQPYKADTPMQIVLKHISDPVPNIRDVLPELPPALNAVMQKVLAKEPEQRYQTAAEFAEDFTRAAHTSPASAAVARVQTPIESAPEPAPTQVGGSDSESGPQPTIIMQQSGLNNPIVLMSAFGLIALVIVIVVVLLTGRNNASGVPPATTQPTAVVEAPTAGATAIPTPVPRETNGRLTFATADALGDTANLQVANLSAPESGTHYVVWLKNSSDGIVLKLGDLTVDAFGNGLLTYRDEAGEMLPALFNQVLITAESGDVDAPTGTVAYSGSVPDTVMQALHAIFVADDSGIDGTSLLASAQTEAQFAVSHSALAANATNLGGMKTHAEHTTNILRGEQVDYNGNGRGENPGRGFGVYVFMDAIESQLNNAINSPGADQTLQVNAQDMQVCAENVRAWADEVVADEAVILSAPDDTDYTTLQADADSGAQTAQYIMNGVDANNNGRIDPFELECGLAQMPEYGILFGSMDIFAGAPDAQS